MLEMVDIWELEMSKVLDLDHKVEKQHKDKKNRFYGGEFL